VSATAAFDDVLDETLRSLDHAAGTARPQTFINPTDPGVQLLLAGGVVYAHVRHPYALPSPERPPDRLQQAPQAPWASQSRFHPTLRVSTPREREAVLTLERLGVHVGAGTTLADLKRGYRALARRFHPDVHPQVSGQERGRLESLFAEASQAYRVLVAAAR
jgi:hypothetical protein